MKWSYSVDPRHVVEGLNFPPMLVGSDFYISASDVLIVALDYFIVTSWAFNDKIGWIRPINPDTI